MPRSIRLCAVVVVIGRDAFMGASGSRAGAPWPHRSGLRLSTGGGRQPALERVPFMKRPSRREDTSSARAGRAEGYVRRSAPGAARARMMAGTTPHTTMACLGSVISSMGAGRVKYTLVSSARRPLARRATASRPSAALRARSPCIAAGEEQERRSPARLPAASIPARPPRRPKPAPSPAPARASHERPEPQLEIAQRDVADARERERELEADVARVPRDGPDEPHLVHRRHDERARERARAERREPRRERARVRPETQVVRVEAPPPDDEVLGEDHRAEGARPVRNEPEEVRERVVKLVGADDGNRNEAARGRRGC